MPIALKRTFFEIFLELVLIKQEILKTIIEKMAVHYSVFQFFTVQTMHFSNRVNRDFGVEGESSVPDHT